MVREEERKEELEETGGGGNGMALNSLLCADVPLRNCSLTHSWGKWNERERGKGKEGRGGEGNRRRQERIREG